VPSLLNRLDMGLKGRVARLQSLIIFCCDALRAGLGPEDVATLLCCGVEDVVPWGTPTSGVVRRCTPRFPLYNENIFQHSNYLDATLLT